MEEKIVLPLIFCDHMILQWRKPVRVWGSCNFNGKIEIRIQGQRVEVSPKEGSWEAELEPMEACLHTEMEIVSEHCQIRIKDIAIGEVWLAGGQSNMEFHMRYDADRESAKDYPYIRMFDYPEVSYEEQLEQNDYSDFGFWRVCDAGNRQWFLAVGYHFAARLFEQYQIPIGIVGCNWGGTPACAWMDPQYLTGTSGEVWLEDYQNAVAGLDVKAYNCQFERNPANYRGKPFENAFLDKMMFGWTEEERKAIFQSFAESGESIPAAEVTGPRDEKRPGGLYDTMMKKVAPYSIRGVIWYQGESDEKHASVYHEVFSSLIRCWRDLWQEELPFLFVQLAPFGHYIDSTLYPLLRQEQEWVAEHVPEAYMASVMDAGDRYDIHPKRKKPVGERLALLALGHVYDEPVACNAPAGCKMEVMNGCIRLEFSHAEGQLEIRGEQVNALEIWQDGQPLSEYQVETEGDSLLIFSDLIRENAFVRVEFAEKDYCEVNLYNKYGLCAKPFIIENNQRRIIE